MSFLVTKTWTRMIAAVVAALAVLAIAPAASAADKITEPSGGVVVVKNDANGKPIPFTVKVTGFPKQQKAFLEQCDGVAPTDPNWSPTKDCDVASSGAPAFVGDDGIALFAKNDPNRVFRLFHGLSPQSQFNCLAPGEKDPKNGFPSYTNCQFRVATTNFLTTPDQVFRPMKFTVGANSGSSNSSSGSSNTALVITLIVVAVIVIGVLLLMLRRRSDKGASDKTAAKGAKSATRTR
jgi:hypothetical protein